MDCWQKMPRAPRISWKEIGTAGKVGETFGLSGFTSPGEGIVLDKEGKSEHYFLSSGGRHWVYAHAHAREWGTRQGTGTGRWELERGPCSG